MLHHEKQGHETFCLHLHSYKNQGMLPNKCGLVADKGMNRDLCNAEHEGGERNGVLTGVEDYLKESSLDYEFILLPLYYGLGILITKQRLAANKKLARVVEKLKINDMSHQLISITEHLRCTDGIMMQALACRLKESEIKIADLEEKLKAARLCTDGK